MSGVAPATPEDAALEIFAKQKGETVHCNWCGQGFSRQEFNELNTHITSLHKTALKPLESVEELAARGAIDLENAEVIGQVVVTDTLSK